MSWIGYMFVVHIRRLWCVVLMTIMVYFIWIFAEPTSTNKRTLSQQQKQEPMIATSTNIYRVNRSKKHSIQTYFFYSILIGILCFFVCECSQFLYVYMHTFDLLFAAKSEHNHAHTEKARKREREREFPWYLFIHPSVLFRSFQCMPSLFFGMLSFYNIAALLFLSDSRAKQMYQTIER